MTGTSHRRPGFLRVVAEKLARQYSRWLESLPLVFSSFSRFPSSLFSLSGKKHPALRAGQSRVDSVELSLQSFGRLVRLSGRCRSELLVDFRFYPPSTWQPSTKSSFVLDLTASRNIPRTNLFFKNAPLRPARVEGARMVPLRFGLLCSRHRNETKIAGGSTNGLP